MSKANGVKRFWVAKSGGEYLVLKNEPTKWYREASWGDGSDIGTWCNDLPPLGVDEFCDKGFDALTGLNLEDGQFAQVELKVVGGVWETTVEAVKVEDNYADN